GANVLVSRDGDSIKLADFGASKQMGHDSFLSGLKGTPQWMAPEVIRGQQTDIGWFKADVWSVGCTVVEMLTGRNPWPDIQHPMAALFCIGKGKRPPLNMEVSPEAQAFISACCAPDPEQRHSVKQLMNHTFLKQSHHVSR
ncbi:unnamed protein product, partial [Choristocarpus tenellus]